MGEKPEASPVVVLSVGAAEDPILATLFLLASAGLTGEVLGGFSVPAFR